MAYDFDLFVIGAGSGGVRAARMAAQTGARVGIAEEYRIGGTCVICGCVPKKYLVYASELGHAIHAAPGYGWSLPGEATLDWERLRDNIQIEVGRLSSIYTRNLRNAGVDIFESRAELLDTHSVHLTGLHKTVTADKILIASGGRPYRPLELKGQEYGITSNEVFHLERLPKHGIVAGGGYIAVEFASIFNGLGVETCLLYRGDTVLRGFDEDVRVHIHTALKERGIRVITHAVFSEIAKSATGFRATLSNGMHLDTELIMYAIGREPYVEGLGLDKAGVRLTEKGAIAVDRFSQSSVPNIYAVGDVTDRVQLTPVAIREGAAFAETVFRNNPTAFDHATIPSAVFTQPPIGVVGLTEVEARKAFGQVDIYKTTFRPMKNMLTGDTERVLMKLIVRCADQVVVGCHIVGPDAPEMIQLAAIAVKAGLTKKHWDDTCALHPTLAEELVTLREKWTPPELKAAE